MSAPDSHPPISAVIALRHVIVSVLWRCGVARRHLEDVYQDCLIAAWMAIAAGRFRPDPTLNQRFVLRAWVAGIAWRQASKHRRRSMNRCEIPVSDPWAETPEPHVDPAGMLDARETLRFLRKLPRAYRELLELAATGHGSTDIGRLLNLSPNTVATRMRRARRKLRDLLARRTVPAPPWTPGHHDAIRTTTRTESGVIGGVPLTVVTVTARNLLRIPESVTEDNLDELRDAGFDVTVDHWSDPIAKALGARWYNPAAYELAKLRFRRGR